MFGIVRVLTLALFMREGRSFRSHSGPYSFSEPFIRHKPIEFNLPRNRVSWTCTEGEDRKLAVERWSPGFEEVPATSFGFLFFVLGEKAEAEVEQSWKCLQAAYGKGINITIYRPSEHDLGCKVNEHTQRDDQACWQKFMALKVEAARSSPYDMTLMLDADVIANPTLKDKHRVIPMLKNMFTRDLWDIVFAEAHGTPHDLVKGSSNGGWVAYKRNAATDRFFCCVQQLMRSNGLNEQGAYQRLTRVWDSDEPQNMISTRTTRLPQQWQCHTLRTPWGKFESNLHYAWNYTCIFIHSHYQARSKEVRETCNEHLRAPEFPPENLSLSIGINEQFANATVHITEKTMA